MKQNSPSFSELGLVESLVRPLEGLGYVSPTPIQQMAIPPALDGRDVLGCARTGTGKTAAFVLPMLQSLLQTRGQGEPGAARADRGRPHRPVRALVLAPTRELAAQIGQCVTDYGGHTRLRHVVVFGGVGQGPQVTALRSGVDVLVATPGRLEDLMSQGHVRLDRVEVLVLDEFDRMLDQGFLPCIRRIARRLPSRRQTLLFSATAPKALEPVVADLMDHPVRVAVSEQASTPDSVDQEVWFVEQPDKRHLLCKLVGTDDVQRAVVFTRTKHGANRLAKQLATSGVAAEAIHGNRTQGQRERTLARFKNGLVRILVATDVAARGLDVDDVSHVFNFDLPADPESYVHRIGRTARAGRSGQAVSLCRPDERDALHRIERLIGRVIPVRGRPTQGRQTPAPTADGNRRQPSPSVSASTSKPSKRRNRRRPNSWAGARASG